MIVDVIRYWRHCIATFTGKQQ